MFTIGEPGVAQNLKRRFSLGGVVFPAQQLEQFVIPGLNAEADAIDSQASKHGSFARRNAARICFHGPLAQRGQIEPIPKTAQKIFELRRGQRGGCAASDENGLRRDRPSGRAAHPVQRRSASQKRCVCELSARSL